MKKPLTTCIILSLLFTGGCTTAYVSQTSGKAKHILPAVAIDLVTFPIQIAAVSYHLVDKKLDQNKTDRLNKVMKRFSEDPEFKEKYLKENILKKDEISYFLRTENRSVLYEDDLVLIWKEYRTIPEVIVKQGVVIHPLATEQIIREHYQDTIENYGVKQLRYTGYLLLHPKLPDDVIRDIGRSGARSDVIKKLSRNPKLVSCENDLANTDDVVIKEPKRCLAKLII